MTEPVHAPSGVHSAVNTMTWSWRSRMLASDAGIRVVEDKTASTFSINNKGELIIPVLNEPPETCVRLLTGATVHEVAHRLWSQFEAVQGLSPIERTFFMIFEDLRIERRAQEEWGGALDDLKGMWTELYRQGQIGRPVAEAEDHLFILAAWMLAWCRLQSVGLDVSREDEGLGRKVFAQLVGDHAVDIVQDHLNGYDRCASSFEVLEFIRRLLMNFVRPDEQTPVDLQTGSPDRPDEEQSESGEAKGQGQGANPGPVDAAPQVQAEPAPPGSGSEGEAAESTEPSNSEATGPAANGAPEASKEDGGAGSSDSCEAATGSQERAPAIDVVDFEPFEVDGGELAAATFAQFAVPSGGRVGTNELASAHTNTPVTSGELLIQEAMAATMAIRWRLRELLRSQARRQVKPGSKGTLNAARAWRVKLGELDVFKPKSDVPDVATHLELLLDMSGSMAGYPAMVAMQTGVAITMACEGLPRVTTAVSMFPGVTSPIKVLKSTKDSARQGAQRMSEASANGGTPLLPALPLALANMIKSNAARQILLIATDGMPSEKSRCKAAISAMKASGREVITVGIGIRADAIDDEAVFIASIEALPAVLFGVLEKRLSNSLKKAA